jgi:hypothetical protein
MSKFKEKAEAQTEQIIGQMLGDDQLVQEGKARLRKVKTEAPGNDKVDTMPKENDLEGPQDQGGKHGGQSGMPDHAQRSAADQGIVRDERGQEQPRDKERARRVSRVDRGGDPPGKRAGKRD